MNEADFTGYTVTTLKGICRNKGIKGYSKLNRAGLIARLIQAANSESDVKIGDTIVWHDSATGNAVYGVVSNTASWGISVRIPFWDHVQGMLFMEYSKITDARIIERVMDDFHSQAMIENIRRAPVTKKPVSLALDYPAAEGRVVTEAHAKLCADKGHTSYVKNGIDMGICPRCGVVTTSEEQVTDEEINSTEIPVQPSVTFFPEGDPRNFDSVNALKVMINALTPLAEAALAACEASTSGPVRDLHYQAHLDMNRAVDEMRRTLMFFDC